MGQKCEGQSKKVKIFGCTTGGMLDISNLNCINSPDGKLNFCYGMTKSYRIPNFCIVDVGVQPDIYFQGLVPEVEWVDMTTYFSSIGLCFGIKSISGIIS